MTFKEHKAFAAGSIKQRINRIIARVDRRWAEKTETKIDDIILGVLRSPSVYWCIAIGLYIGIAVSEFPEKYVFYIARAIHILVIFSVTIAAANLTGNIFRDYIQPCSMNCERGYLKDLRKRA